MATKQKKPRNKKYNPKAAANRTAHTIAENALNRITFVGSSIRPIGPYAGRGFQFTTSPRMRMAATDMLIGGLFDEPRNWKLWVAHLYETDNGVQAETVVATLDDYTLSDFCQHGDKIIKSLRETEENYFGYAFVAAPNERYDFDQGEERLLENFMHSGLLDKSLHLPEEELMVSRKDMVTLLLADRGRFDVTESHVRKVQKLVDKVDETDLDTSEVATRIQSVVNQEEDY